MKSFALSRARISSAFAVAAIAVGGCAAGAFAADQTPESFYQQNGLKMVVASGAGGGYDTYTRVLQRYYSAHLPGHPNVVVENMPGAAGLTATNWAYNVAPRDGSQMLATYSALIDSNLVGNTKARFDVRKFNWIGSIASTTLICVDWNTSPYKDIRQMVGKPLTVSTTGMTAHSAMMPLMLNEVLGTQFKVIAGYGTTEMVLALERHEVDAICGIGLSTLKASNPEWLIDKKVNVVAQVGLSKDPELQDVPNILDLVTGADHDLVEYGAIIQAMGRPYLAPPNVPADRLAVLRKGFDDTMKDPAFVTDVEKLRLNVSAMSGDDMGKWIDKLYSFSPDTIKREAKFSSTD
jgi:tripartite-type tricarboxylate transporter receptor subunit TctC